MQIYQLRIPVEGYHKEKKNIKEQVLGITICDTQNQADVSIN